MFSVRLKAAALGTIAVVIVGIVACGDDSAAATLIDPGDGGNYNPAVDPAKFVARIDNAYFPFAPGNRWVYRSDDGKERIEVTVLDETRVVMGITATVVRDVVFEEGEIIEDTFDWYAQDAEGNVWYLGEDSTEFENGKAVNKDGSWEAGVDGAKPGIVMLAKPTVGKAYRQEFYPGEAEDMARVDKVDGQETLAAGSFSAVVVTTEWTPLDAEVAETKAYAPGVGLIVERKVQGGTGEVFLESFTPRR